MAKKDQVLASMVVLSDALDKSHEGSATARYVAGTLTNLQHCEGVGFSGTLQDFLQHAPVVRQSDNIALSNAETQMWNKVFSFTNLCNNQSVVSASVQAK